MSISKAGRQAIIYSLLILSIGTVINIVFGPPPQSVTFVSYLRDCDHTRLCNAPHAFEVQNEGMPQVRNVSGLTKNSVNLSDSAEQVGGEPDD
jgi:hypothetical protein